MICAILAPFTSPQLKISDYLHKSIDPYAISLFRALLGIVLFLQSIYLYFNGTIKEDIIEATFHFQWVEWIKVYSPQWIYFLFTLQILSALLLIIGYRSRLMSFIYTLVFSYLWLIDKGIFNNHYYLISLMTLLLSVIPSDAYFSIRPQRKMQPMWHLRLLQFQIALVIMVAGFNKLNYWWLIEMEPVKHILQAKALQSGNSFWASSLMQYLFVYGGLLIDLFIVPMLLWDNSRRIAVLLFILFNLINSITFYSIGEIGIFPLMMIFSLVLFIPVDDLKRLEFRIRSRRQEYKLDQSQHQLGRAGVVLLSVYIIVQILLPIRHHFFPGNVDYTGEGQRFSWRMKSMYKDFEIGFILEDEQQGIRAELDPRQILRPKQYTNLGYYPELIIDVGQNLKKTALERGIDHPKVYVNYKVGFMGRPLQKVIDPKTEINELSYSPFHHSEWILPLKLD